MHTSPKKILIIRFSSIGDIVLTSPVIRTLKQQIAGSEIHFVTKKAFAPILSANPYLDKIHLLEKDMNRLIKDLQAEQFDCIIDLHKNIRSNLIKRKLNIPTLNNFDKLNIQKWLIVNLKINKLPNKHIVDRYFEGLANLNIQNDKKGLDYFIPERDEIALRTLPDFFQKGYIGIVIGAKHFTKQIPIQKIITICNKLKSPILLLGDKNDHEKGEKIIEQTKNNIYNVCGQYNINQTASIIKQSNGIITSDTGLMHIAAALDKPIISLWGNTIPAFGMYPYMRDESKSHISEIAKLKCRPCSKLGYAKCPKQHFNCMNLIDDEKIINLAKQIF